LLETSVALHFDQLVAAATKAIGRKYFAVPVVGGLQVFRERVYCYELYHQMRCIWPNDSHLVLHGELAKNGHPQMVELVGGITIPDFLVHDAGSMDNNYAVIEVKCATSLTPNEIRKDLRKLHAYVHGAKYRRAIYLVFSEGTDVVADISAQTVSSENRTPIEVWQHVRCGDSATLCSIVEHGYCPSQASRSRQFDL